jgi:hypothetical protein
MRTSKISLNHILFVAVAIMAILMLRQCGKIESLKTENQVGVQNIVALNDSIRVIKNEWNEDIVLKNSFIVDKEDLEELNQELANQVKRLEGEVLYISNVLSTIKNDTVYVENEVIQYPDGVNELSWSFENDFGNGNSRILGGNSKFILDTLGGAFNIIDKGTTISRDILNLRLTTGLTELDDSYQIYVKTDYPGITFSEIDGAILDKDRFMKQTQPNWIFGPSVYFGLGIDPLNRTAGPQIGVGLSVTFNLNKYINNIFRK